MKKDEIVDRKWVFISWINEDQIGTEWLKVGLEMMFHGKAMAKATKLSCISTTVTCKNPGNGAYEVGEFS